MNQQFTQLDLIRFIYRETSSSETIAITEALNDDPLLLEEYMLLYGSYLAMPKAKFSPRPETLQKILNYSEQTALNAMH